MPTGPDDGARLAFEAVELVTAAELAVLRAVAERLRAGMDAPGWAASKLAELQLLRAGLARDLAAMDVALAAQVTSTLRSAYRNGQALAVADLDDVSVRPVLPPARWAAVETLAADVGSRVTGHAPRVLRAVTDAYQQAVGAGAGSVVLGGQTRRQAAQSVLDRLLGEGITGFTDRGGRNWHLESYVEMAVRTGAGQAAIQGHVDTLAASGQDLVQVIPGPRACPVCDGWAGKVLSATGGTTSIVATGASSVVDGTLEDARGAGWGHPNCFPGWVTVSAPTGVSAADARWFEGELVVVHTASGRELAVTPNHPVLTSRGWVAAGDLEEGFDLVRYRGDDERVPAGGPDHEGRHASIGEVFEALRQSRGVTAVAVPGAAEQFHGDGTDAEVHVVLADGLLDEHGQPASFERAADGSFLVGGVRLPSLLGPGPLLEVGTGAGHAADGVVGGGGEAGPLLGAGAGHADGHGLPAAADGDAGSAQAEVDHIAGDAIGGRELLDRLSGLVARDEVVNVERRDWRGHVFNLETGGGWYVASDYIVHNCRCTLGIYLPGVTSPLVHRPDPGGYVAGQRQRELERRIRSAKRGRVLALDDAAAKQAGRKVREAQEALRVHLAAYPELKRLRYREQIGQAI